MTLLAPDGLCGSIWLHTGSYGFKLVLMAPYRPHGADGWIWLYMALIGPHGCLWLNMASSAPDGSNWLSLANVGL